MRERHHVHLGAGNVGHHGPRFQVGRNVTEDLRNLASGHRHDQEFSTFERLRQVPIATIDGTEARGLPRPAVVPIVADHFEVQGRTSQGNTETAAYSAEADDGDSAHASA